MQGLTLSGHLCAQASGHLGPWEIVVAAEGAVRATRSLQGRPQCALTQEELQVQK